MNPWQRYGKRFESFIQLIKWAKEGKTFIYIHPDMVAMDMKTWKKLQSKLTPKIQVFYDEYEQLTPEKEKALLELLPKLRKK